jgi:thiol-disulfide isomerase/thioredoxin
VRAAAAALLLLAAPYPLSAQEPLHAPAVVATAAPATPAVVMTTGPATPAPAATLLDGAAAPSAGDDVTGPGIHALLLNGGGRREINYRSHLQHVRTLVELLTAAGVPRARLTVFSADGDDPASDLAVREDAPARGAWLLPGSVAGPLGPQIEYDSSTLDGVPLRPAKLEALRAWFATDGARLRAGDTLLLYVTDHGDKNEDDVANNTITLWGEALSVGDLQTMLASLDPAVRVVMLMSQCYAGAFARLMYRAPGDALPAGNVCGYFAAPPDRPAYGCYPENRGKDGVGLSHHFFAALPELELFSEANRRVLVTDGSPDVPHSTSDVFLERAVRAAAEAEEREPRAFADALLATAWQNRAAWEPEIRLLDGVGRAFGSFSPRSIAELDEQARALPELSSRLKTYADRWPQTLESLRMVTFERFLDAHPEWRPRLVPAKLAALDADRRRATQRQLLADYVPFTGHDPARHARLLFLKRKADDAAAAHYRAEVRVGSVLRLRKILLGVAGRVLLADGHDAAGRATLERMSACETFSLDGAPPTVTAAALPPPPPFPPLSDEQRTIEALMPAYMGIEFKPLEAARRERLHLGTGAVGVMRVYDDSPAAAAGLKVGDVIIGPLDAPFTEPHQVREWTMRREVDVPAPLRVWRDDEIRTVTLRPGPYPLALPKLPGPPKIGSVAPGLELEVFRGATDLAAAQPRLLFYWATWCTICKHAVPELLAYAQTHDVDVIAITDEDAETLAPFFRDWRDPFPEIVAIDAERKMLQRFGVSGTPTFVLIDGAGVVREYQTGYPAAGLKFAGWNWQHEMKALAPDGVLAPERVPAAQ